MPGILLAFFILVGAGAGSALIDPVAPVYGKPWPTYQSGDPLQKAKKVKHPTPVSYFVNSSPSGLAFAKPNSRKEMVCEVSYIAHITGGGKAELAVGTESHGVDNGWIIHSIMRVDTRETVVFQFLDPPTGKLLFQATKVETCIHDPGTNYGELYDERGILR